MVCRAKVSPPRPPPGAFFCHRQIPLQRQLLSAVALAPPAPPASDYDAHGNDEGDAVEDFDDRDDNVHDDDPTFYHVAPPQPFAMLRSLLMLLTVPQASCFNRDTAASHPVLSKTSSALNLDCRHPHVLLPTIFIIAPS